MSISKEILLGAGAISFGFTVATGINITYFAGVDRNVEIQTKESELSRIPEFWKEYNQKRTSGIEVDDETKKKVCITVDGEKICIELPEN